MAFPMAGKETGAMNSLVRPARGKIIAGVCAALANRFGWSVGLVRLLVILSCLLPGPQVIAYIVLWILIPKERDGVRVVR
jgi:phage shock protein PspC (stress-responsive transcriptional regulator)